MGQFIKDFWKTIVWAVIIIILSCLPDDHIESQKWNILPHQDKILHFLFYSILSILFIREYQKHSRRPELNSVIFAISFVFIIAFGTILEIIQEKFVRSRNGELMDLLFDIFGFVLAFLSLYLYGFIRHYNKRIKN
ncbi:MAG: hypothetical protein AMS27_03855 [Bacteroides sp. SM23_62_1]|nr:MAG: hypothetical protein AMS27_03855 [Bacteroides sp. SM23_62_1]